MLREKRHVETTHFYMHVEFLERIKPYKVDEDLIVVLVESGLIEAYAFVDGEMTPQVPEDGMNLSLLYFSKDDIDICISALKYTEAPFPSMMVFKQSGCGWHTYDFFNDFAKMSAEIVRIYLPSSLLHRYPLSREKILNQCLAPYIACIKQSECIEIVFRTEDDRMRALIKYEFPGYVEPNVVAAIVTQQRAAFELIIHRNIRAQAKQYKYYPVRYIKLSLPE
jgi:hypothetical protein